MPDFNVNVTILGPGRVGGSLAALLPESLLWGRDAEVAQRVAKEAGVSFESSLEKAVQADIILLTLPDRAIGEMVETLLSLPSLPKGAVVAHTAGALPPELLLPLKERGLFIGKLHPMFPFSSPFTPLPANVVFGIEGDEPAVERLSDLARHLLGIPLIIPPDGRVFYHLIGVFGSNFVMGMIREAENLCRSLFPHTQPKTLLLPLLEGTLHNYEELGAEKGLTGPLVRGDEETLDLHRRALQRSAPELLPLYNSMVKTIGEKGTYK